MNESHLVTCSSCGERFTLEEWMKHKFCPGPKCSNYKRPEGVLGGPCLNCGRSQPEHK